MTKSLRKSMKHFTFTTDRAFMHVIRSCADPRRTGSWITEEMIELYQGLHDDGWAHSVEVWNEDELVGGLYGVAIGSFFAGESMFHTQRDASKAALAHLVGLFDGTNVVRGIGPAASADHDSVSRGWLIDTQWQTSHLSTLGVSEINGLEYSAHLESALRGSICQDILNK